jgi:ribosomal protein L37E
MAYYQCVRCGGRDVYASEETTSYTAMTIDNPGPIDHTLVNANKQKIARCRACGERADYILTRDEVAKDNKIIIGAIVGSLIGIPILFFFVMKLSNAI